MLISMRYTPLHFCESIKYRFYMPVSDLSFISTHTCTIVNYTWIVYSVNISFDDSILCTVVVLKYYYLPKDLYNPLFLQFLKYFPNEMQVIFTCDLLNKLI